MTYATLVGGDHLFWWLILFEWYFPSGIRWWHKKMLVTTHRWQSARGWHLLHTLALEVGVPVSPTGTTLVATFFIILFFFFFCWAQPNDKTWPIGQDYRVSQKNAPKIVWIISPATITLDGWDISHMKGGVWSSVWSTKQILCNISEPRCKEIKIVYHN